MNRRSTDPPYWPAPAVEERLARVEERLDNLIRRVESAGRSLRFTLTAAVGAAAAIGAILTAVIR